MAGLTLAAAVATAPPPADAQPLLGVARAPFAGGCGRADAALGVSWKPPGRVAPAGSEGVSLEEPELLALRGSDGREEILALSGKSTVDLRRPGAVPLAELANSPLARPRTASDSARFARRPFDAYRAPGFRIDASGAVRALRWPAGTSRFPVLRAVATGDTAHVVWATGTSFAAPALPALGTVPDAPGQPPSSADTLWHAWWRDGSWSEPTPIWTGPGLHWEYYAAATLVHANGELHFMAPATSPATGTALLYVHGRAGRWTAATVPFRQTVGGYPALAVRSDSSLVIAAIAGQFADSAGPNNNSVLVIRAASDGTVRDQRVVQLSGWRPAHRPWITSDSAGRLRLYWERAAPEDRAGIAFGAMRDRRGRGSADGHLAPAASGPPVPAEVMGVRSDDGGETWQPLQPLTVPGLFDSRFALGADGDVWMVARANGSDAARTVVAARAAAGRWSTWTLWSTSRSDTELAAAAGLVLADAGVPHVLWSVLLPVDPRTHQPEPLPAGLPPGTQKLAYTLAAAAVSCAPGVAPREATPHTPRP